MATMHDSGIAGFEQPSCHLVLSLCRSFHLGTAGGSSGIRYSSRDWLGNMGVLAIVANADVVANHGIGQITCEKHAYFAGFTTELGQHALHRSATVLMVLYFSVQLVPLHPDFFHILCFPAVRRAPPVETLPHQHSFIVRLLPSLFVTLSDCSWIVTHTLGAFAVYLFNR